MTDLGLHSSRQLEPHVRRMQQEFYQLCDRLAKLGLFLLGPAAFELDPAERALLNAQLHAMRTYAVILQARLNRAGIAAVVPGTVS